MSLPTSPEDHTLLVLGAHPDDIEFGCGAIVAQETQSGAKAHFVICSQGESASRGTPAERVRQSEKSAALLGATLEFIHLGGDAHLEFKNEHSMAIAAIIRRVRPRILLAPTTEENQHPDHAVVGRLAQDAARLSRYGGVKELRALASHSIELLLHYAITVEGEPKDVFPVLIDVSDENVMAQWQAAMQAHASQLNMRNYLDLQKSRARLNGLRAGVENAIALFPNDPLVFTNLRQVGRSARHF